ncbi:DUF550 domain-containing protein [Raoultella terrigena]|uniref:DUF550 domain-containing protein n=1 Tax=Raoultella terrigena TaxID=577 RepID=UPI0038914C07
MTKSTITRERVEELVAQFDEDGGCDATDRQLEALIRQSLAAMDSDPVAEVLSNRPGNDTSTIDRALPVGTQLYRHAQPASEREQVRQEHAEWSRETFGNVGPVGPLKHLSKEALEAASEPSDLSEWADMQFLLWDAQRRAGITDEQITQVMIDKLAVNKQREWPEPKEGEPRLHIKEQPAPVVPDEVTAEDCPALVKYDVTEVDEAWARGFNACRAAMLQAGNSPVIPDGYVIVPKEPTEDMIAAAMNCDDVLFNSDESFCVQFGNIYEAMLAAAPQEVK